MKNLPSGGSATVQIVAFTPKPRLVKMLLTPAAEDRVQVNHAALTATRFLVRPQLGLLASLLITSVPDLKCWILGGEAPAFIRFEGPLYFMGPSGESTGAKRHLAARVRPIARAKPALELHAREAPRLRRGAERGGFGGPFRGPPCN